VLVIGTIRTDGLLDIYISIGMSALAAALVFIAVLHSRRRRGG
jgi:hypothetical protein